MKSAGDGDKKKDYVSFEQLCDGQEDYDSGMAQRVAQRKVRAGSCKGAMCGDERTRGRAASCLLHSTHDGKPWKPVHIHHGPPTRRPASKGSSSISSQEAGRSSARRLLHERQARREPATLNKFC